MPQQSSVQPNIGVAAALAFVISFVSGCGQSDVEVHSPALSGADASACAQLVSSLPGMVADVSRRTTEPKTSYGAAWGDPPIVLRCGVPKPSGFDKTSSCMVAGGVGWFVPEDQLSDTPREIVTTTIGLAQNVEVRLPSAYWPSTAALVDLGPAITASIQEIKPCV